MSGWPSGLRRCVQVAVSSGGVGSNPTSDRIVFFQWFRDQTSIWKASRIAASLRIHIVYTHTSSAKGLFLKSCSVQCPRPLQQISSAAKTHSILTKALYATWQTPFMQSQKEPKRYKMKNETSKQKQIKPWSFLLKGVCQNSGPLDPQSNILPTELFRPLSKSISTGNPKGPPSCL